MKKVRHIAAALALIMLFSGILFLFTGCPPKGGSVGVIIIGKHANANDNFAEMIEQYAGDKEDFLLDCFEYYKDGGRFCAKPKLALIIADGTPQVELYSTKVLKSVNQKGLKKQIKNYLADFSSWIGTLQPKEAETDLLAAINEGKNYLNGFPDAVNQYMLILDTGYSTAGLLDLSVIDRLQDKTADEVVNGIPDASLCDLSSVEVFFDDLGNVCDPQTDLGDPMIQKLIVDIWTRLFARMKSFPEIRYSSKSGTPMYSGGDGIGFPHVSEIMFFREGPDIVIPPSQQLDLNWIANQAAFVDTSKSQLQIQQRGMSYSDYMAQNPEQKLYVVSTRARLYDDNWADHETDTVSTARTRLVVEYLSKLAGIDADRIVMIDAGTADLSWCVYTDDNGTKWTEAQAYDALQTCTYGTAEYNEAYARLCNVQAKHRTTKLFLDAHGDILSEVKNANLLDSTHIIRP